MKKRGMLMNRFVLFILFEIIAVGIVVGAIFLNKQPTNPFSPPQTKVTEPISKDEPVAKCKANDTACEERNEKIMVNKLQGQSVAFAKHQCDGPRACPTPEPAVDDAAMTAIDSYTKDKDVELIRITGINATGQIYYCAKDNKCWSYDTKTKNVEQVASEDNNTTPANQ